MTVRLVEGTRNSYMDFLKGIAIIAVIVGHLISDVKGMDILFNLIYSFHMPLLFFISAYIEEENRVRYVGKEGRMLVRRMRGLLFPYLSWTVINVIISGNLWKTGGLELFLELFGYVNNGLWFFPVLFGLKAMHALYRIIRSKIGREMIVTDILLLGGLEVIVAVLAVLTKQPFLVNMLSYAIPYFFAVILVDHDEIQKLVCSEWVAAGVIFLYVMVFPYFSFYDTRWITQVIRIGLSLCVIAICCKFMDKSDQWEKNRLYSVLCVYGENSLAIYVLYGFFIDYKGYFNMIDSAFLVGVASIVLAFLIAAICIVIARIIGISSWWRRILFGK